MYLEDEEILEQNTDEASSRVHFIGFFTWICPSSKLWDAFAAKIFCSQIRNMNRFFGAVFPNILVEALSCSTTREAGGKLQIYFLEVSIESWSTWFPQISDMIHLGGEQKWPQPSCSQFAQKILDMTTQPNIPKSDKLQFLKFYLSFLLVKSPLKGTFPGSSQWPFRMV